MTADEFWALIDTARSLADGDPDETAAAVERMLMERDPDEIYAYLEQEARVMERSYSWSLWGAAYITNGGCSDDGFDYWRGWLIAQGRDVFEAVLANPDSLTDLDVEIEDAECEDMISAGGSSARPDSRR